jgi:hypothetical protein
MGPSFRYTRSVLPIGCAARVRLPLIVAVSSA